MSELNYCMVMCLPTLLLPSPSITRYTPRPAGAAASVTAALCGQVQVSPSFRSPISIAISSAAAAPVGVGGRRSPSAAAATAAAAVAATIAGTSMTVVVVVAVPVQRQARVVIPVLPHSPLPSSPCCAAVAWMVSEVSLSTVVVSAAPGSLSPLPLILVRHVGKRKPQIFSPCAPAAEDYASTMQQRMRSFTLEATLHCPRVPPSTYC